MNNSIDLLKKRIFIIIVCFIVINLLVFDITFWKTFHDKKGISPILEYDESTLMNYDNFITPTECEIIEILKTVYGIEDVQAVTYTTDINRKLSKDNGYYSSIYFSYSLIDNIELSEESVVEIGVEAGGNIELYRNNEDAETRIKDFERPLKKFIGNGGHIRIGTIVIRTSMLLSENQQQELANNIIRAIDNEK